MQYGLRLPLVDVAFSRRQLTREVDHVPDIMHRSFSGIEIPGNKIGRAYGTLFILSMNFKILPLASRFTASQRAGSPLRSDLLHSHTQRCPLLFAALCSLPSALCIFSLH